MIVLIRDASLPTEVKLSEGCRLIATGVGRKADVSEWSQTMGLNREDKAAVIAEISEVVSNSSAMVIAEYRGLTVQAVTKLRAEARKNGVTLRVAGLADQFAGPLVYGFSADPVAVAKVLVNFAKDNEKLVVKGGAMANYVMDVEAVKQLASMPSRDELLAKLMATMNEPIAKFVRTINEVPARFVRTVAAVRDAKEQAAA